MTKLPGLHERAYERRRFLVNHQALVRGQDVLLGPDTQSPLAPAHRILPGTVIVRELQGERFTHPGSPTASVNRPAAVSSLAPADAAWGGTVITASLATGLGVAVPLPAQVADNAAAIDALNQNSVFQVLFLADEDQQGNVRVRTRAAGSTTYLHVRSSIDAAFGPQGASGSGADADYRVTDALGELRDLDGRPLEASVATLLAGHFFESELLHLTPEARVVLARRGSVFGG